MTTTLGEPGTPRSTPVEVEPSTVPLNLAVGPTGLTGRLRRVSADDEAATALLPRILDEAATVLLPRILDEPSGPAGERRRYDRDVLSRADRQAKLRAFVLATTLSLGTIMLLRAHVQQQWGEVTGLDTGNWLTLGHAWLGAAVAGSGSTYPPVVPVLAALLAEVLTPQDTLMVLGIVGTAVYGGGAAAVLWRAGCGWWSLPLCVLLAAGSAAGEAVAWGGIPQLISLGLAMVGLYLIAELLITPRPRPAWLLGGVLLALGATSHLILAVIAGAAILMALARLTWSIPRPTWARMRGFASIWLRVGLPCLMLVPLYLRLLTTVGDSYAERNQSQAITGFLTAVDHAVRELPLMWRPAIAFCLVLPLLLWKERRHPLWLMTTSLSVLLCALAVFSPEPRFAYVVPLMVVSGFGLLAATGPLTRRTWLRAAGSVLLVTAVLASSLRASEVFPSQVKHYGHLVPTGTHLALEDLRARTDPDDVVLVPPVRGLPFGWWVEGYGERQAFVGSSALWLNFARERERAEVSVRLFSQTDVLSDHWFAAVREAGIDVIYLPGNYDGVSDEMRAVARTMNPELVLHASDAALVMVVP